MSNFCCTKLFTSLVWRFSFFNLVFFICSFLLMFCTVSCGVYQIEVIFMLPKERCHQNWEIISASSKNGKNYQNSCKTMWVTFQTYENFPYLQIWFQYRFWELWCFSNLLKEKNNYVRIFPIFRLSHEC